MAVGWVTNMIQRGAASINRINAILDIKGEIELATPIISPTPVPLPNGEGDNNYSLPLGRAGEGQNNYLESYNNTLQSIKGDIEFDSVYFSYPTKNFLNEKVSDIENSSKNISRVLQRDVKNTNLNVLSNVNFRIKQGTMLGIAGPPGSGKSTLLSLIPRIYNLDNDSVNMVMERDNKTLHSTIDSKQRLNNNVIRVDGMDIASIPIQTLRQSISFMPQEPFLFSGTIKDNLLFGNPDADSELIAKAIEMAQLTETIKSFPKGIDTIIGEKGVMLSGGQKQRIALARAFLKSSPILILDDPVSQVDMETASNIIEVIESFMNSSPPKTIVIASHRFSIFKKAYHIIVLDKGEIIEQGTHNELIEQNGYYTRAWQMQDSEDDVK
ncbi:MAG: ABC transporter ATP-binding protein [Desulfamplus sp.]|nr:ABC transporter ATP-binding protein [Desulfamplus sp.]